MAYRSKTPTAFTNNKPPDILKTKFSIEISKKGVSYTDDSDFYKLSVCNLFTPHTMAPETPKLLSGSSMILQKSIF